MLKPRKEDFDNCIELLICLMCKRYIGQGSGYYTIKFDDEPGEIGYAHDYCAEREAIYDEEEDDSLFA